MEGAVRGCVWVDLGMEERQAKIMVELSVWWGCECGSGCGRKVGRVRRKGGKEGKG